MVSFESVIPATAVTVSSSPAPAGDRLPHLDVLRTVAVLLVLGSHPPVKLDGTGPLMPLAKAYAAVGWTGVDLFFVLSGFLIGGLLFAEIVKTGTLDARQFMIRRAFKIWPAYYFCLLVQVLIILRQEASMELILPYLLHVQNYIGVPERLAPHLWSLAVEEHFYLLLPLCLVVWRRPRASILVPAFVILAAVCAWLRLLHGGQPPLIMTHLRIDSLACGVLLAFAYHFHRPLFDKVSSYSKLLWIGGLGLLVLTVTLSRGAEPFRALAPTGLFVSYGAILLAVLKVPTHVFQNRVLRLMAVVGFYSYSIYLWHFDLGYRLIYLLGMAARTVFPGWLVWPLGMLAYIVITVATGVLLARCIEMPALALRDKWFPRRSPVIQT